MHTDHATARAQHQLATSRKKNVRQVARSRKPLWSLLSQKAAHRRVQQSQTSPQLEPDYISPHHLTNPSLADTRMSPPARSLSRLRSPVQIASMRLQIPVMCQDLLKGVLSIESYRPFLPVLTLSLMLIMSIRRLDSAMLRSMHGLCYSGVRPPQYRMGASSLRWSTVEQRRCGCRSNSPWQRSL